MLDEIITYEQPQVTKKRSLFRYKPYAHTPRDINEHIKSTLGINDHIAIALTQAVGSMWCTYVFIFLAAIGFPGTGATLWQYVSWTSQTFIQLVMLPVLAVGQKLLSRKQELATQEQFETTQKTYHDTEELRQHLSAQDDLIIWLKYHFTTVEHSVLARHSADEDISNRLEAIEQDYKKRLVDLSEHVAILHHELSVIHDLAVASEDRRYRSSATRNARRAALSSGGNSDAHLEKEA